MSDPGSARQLGVYVHWPYCTRLCPYCDFNVVRDRGAETTPLVEAIVADLVAWRARTGPRRLTSLFFGGGTPSLMEPNAAARVIDTARALWSAAPDVEVTLEANPTDAEVGRFAAFAAAGVGRLSLGVQSLSDETLRFLGRNHDAVSARRAVAIAAGIFPRLSLDFIYALPGQSIEAWAGEIAEGATLGAEHLSLYQLTVEAGTAFDRAARRGVLKPVSADLAADLFETTALVLERIGFKAYEISNHARSPSAQSRHNLGYWRGHDYAGVGPGAHGRLTLGAERWASLAPRSVAGYQAAATGGATAATWERLDERSRAVERLLLGLRTAEGVELADLAALNIPAAQIEALRDFVAVKDGRLAATRAGRLVLDRVVAELAGSA